MLIKKGEYEINEKIFFEFQKRWLKTNEIYLILKNARKLIAGNFFSITNNFENINPISGNFNFIKKENLKNFFLDDKKKILKKSNKTKLKYDGQNVY